MSDADVITALLTEVLKSESFAESKDQRRLLTFLVKETLAGDGEIDVIRVIDRLHAAHKGDPFSLQNQVRTAVSRLRDRLDEYFNTDPSGRRQPTRLSIPKTNWRVEIRPNRPAPREDSVRLFWAPHARENERTVFVYSEPLFFKDSKGTYFRRPGSNDARDNPSFSYLQAEPLIPSRQFVSAGEVQAMLLLFQVLHQYDIKLRSDVAVETDLGQYANESIIVFGTKATNPLIDAIHRDDFTFVASLRGVDRKSEAGSEVSAFEDEVHLDSSVRSIELDKYAVVTRCPHLYRDHAITMIEANHGRAAQGVATFLTSAAEVNELLNHFDGGDFPCCFQVVFKVVLRKNPAGVAVRKIEIIATQTYAP